MHPEIADKKDRIARICRRHDVARLEVFGSAARGADFDPVNSDVDFLVEFCPDSALQPFDRYFDLLDSLSEVLGRPVDLLSVNAIKNRYLLAAINKSRELVYAA